MYHVATKKNNSCLQSIEDTIFNMIDMKNPKYHNIFILMKKTIFWLLTYLSMRKDLRIPSSILIPLCLQEWINDIILSTKNCQYPPLPVNMKTHNCSEKFQSSQNIHEKYFSQKIVLNFEWHQVYYISLKKNKFQFVFQIYCH